MSEMYSNADKRVSDIAVAVFVVLVFASLPGWADKGLLFLAAVVMIKIVFAMSFNLVFGLTGLVSFGHAAFFAAGAYTTGLLLQSHGQVPFLLSWLASGLMGGLVAVLVALIALRRASGIYFAILTLALAELVHILIAKSDLLGREDGMTGIKRPLLDLGVFSIDLAAANNLYYVTMVCCAVLCAVLYALWHNRIGRLLAAIRQDPDRVRFLGVNVHTLKFMAFVVSGALSGLAGGLYAPVAQLLTPEIAHWSYSALPILFCLVGGVSYFWGPLLGAVVFMGLEHVTRNVVGLSEILIGTVLLLVVLVFPGGLIGGIRAVREKIRGSVKTETAVEKMQRSA